MKETLCAQNSYCAGNTLDPKIGRILLMSSAMVLIPPTTISLYLFVVLDNRAIRNRAP